MGTILNGILGGVSGKVGGVVGSDWKGIKTLRAYAIPANPNTAGQVTQRSKFGAIVAFAKLMLGTVIQPYWDQFAVQQSGYNAFCSANLLLWTTSSDYANAVVSQGALALDSIDDFTYNNATGAIEVNWTNAGLGDGLATDLAVAVVVDSGNNIAFVSDANAIRSAEQDTFNIGSGRTVGDLKGYLFFYRGAGPTLYVSNSDYLQITVP